MSDTYTLIDDEKPAKEFVDLPNWSEHYAWAGYDPASNIGHFFSFGRWIGDLDIWRSLLLVALPNGKVLASKAYGQGTEDAASSGELTYRVVEPKKKFQLTYNAPIACYDAKDLATKGYYVKPRQKMDFELNFASSDPLIDFGAAGDSNSITGKGHIDQQGLVTGFINFDGKSYELTSSFTNRDHSRGPRDVSQYKRHGWMSGRLDSGLKFWIYYAEILDHEGPVMREAAVCKDGVVYYGEVVSMAEDCDNNNYMAPFTVIIRTELGEMELRGTPVNMMPLSFSTDHFDAFPGWSLDYDFDNASVHEQNMHWEWVGHEKGIGHSERGRRTQR